MVSFQVWSGLRLTVDSYSRFPVCLLELSQTQAQEMTQVIEHFVEYTPVTFVGTPPIAHTTTEGTCAGTQDRCSSVMCVVSSSTVATTYKNTRWKSTLHMACENNSCLCLDGLVFVFGVLCSLASMLEGSRDKAVWGWDLHQQLLIVQYITNDKGMLWKYTVNIWKNFRKFWWASSFMWVWDLSMHVLLQHKASHIY